MFLASYVREPNTWHKLENFVGGLKDKKIAYIPTASNGEGGWESWKSSNTWEQINNSGAVVTPVVLEEYRNASVLKILDDNEILWFVGGMAGYLMYWIKRCGIDKYLLDKNNSNKVYVGSSAGSMVAGRSLEIAEFDFGDKEYGASEIRPMNLVDFDIYPHYEDSLYEKIKAQYIGNKLYLLKNGEEIIVDGDKIIVQGEERIIENW